MDFGPENPYGTAWKTNKTTVAESSFADAAPFTNRVFKILNEQKINPCVFWASLLSSSDLSPDESRILGLSLAVHCLRISQRPVGYKLVPLASQLQLSHPESVAHKRGEFGGHAIWYELSLEASTRSMLNALYAFVFRVTKYQDGELFAAGNYT
jgi:primary-amine oxidase